MSNYSDNLNSLGRAVWSVVHRYMLSINIKAKVACASAYKYHRNRMTITKNKATQMLIIIGCSYPPPKP